jgi:hypothetical protein
MATLPTLPGLPDNPEQIVRLNGSWFELGLGVNAGRVEVSSGEFSMILGQLVSNELATMQTGDYIELSQVNVDLSDVDYLTFPAAVIGRELGSVDVAWMASILVDGTVYSEKEIKPEKEMNWADFKAPVQLITGTADVAVRLTIVEV